jgi:methylase of polypeptide subunit release factors
LAALKALFIDGAAFDPVVAAKVLGVGLKILLAAGLLVRRQDVVRRAVLLVPHEGVLVASDDPDYEGADYVAGVQRPSHILALLTPRGPVESAADVGTGCGIQALLVAAHARRVIATDLNERALELCELNAGLNNIANVETRRGSFLEPLGNESLDLIVANPPYVVSPATEYLFRDAGRGDAVSEELVRAVAERLAPRGHAVVMISWVANDDDAVERPLSWVQDDCGAVLVVTEVKDAATDAEAWVRAGGARDPEAEAEQWREWYREHGIVRLAYGAIAIRRGGRGRVTVLADLDDLGPAGDQLVGLLDAQEAEPVESAALLGPQQA